MTADTGAERGARHETTNRYLRAGLAVLRVLAAVAVLLIAYYLLPFERSATWEVVMVLVIGMVLLIGLIA